MVELDRRGVSTLVSYALTLGIATTLVTGLLVASGSFIEDQRERTIRGQFEVVGQQVAADLAATDRLVQAGGSGTTASVTREHPPSAAGRQYRITLDDVAAGPSLVRVTLTTEDPAVTVTVRVRVQTDVTDGTVSGGDVAVRYTGSALEVVSA